MKEANISFKRITGNIRQLEESGHLKEGFSLKILQDFWVNLKSQDEFAQELGLDGRTSLVWILHKIGFVNYNTHYKTLLLSSNPETCAVIAAKTTAWNAAHPDLMRARNKHAAQFMKTPENRAAHSLRIKKCFEEHPERREQVSKSFRAYWSDPSNRAKQSYRGIEYLKNHPEKRQNMSKTSKAAWEKIPEIRQVMSSFLRITYHKIKSSGQDLEIFLIKILWGLP